jgi:outer membrane protein TolC
MGVVTMKKIIFLFISTFLFVQNVQAKNLSEAVQYALQNDPLLNSSDYEVAATKDDQDKDCGALYPQVSTPIQYLYYDQDESGTPITAGSGGSATPVSPVSGTQLNLEILATQSLFDLPRIGLCRLGDQKTQYSRISQKIARQDVLYRTSKAYFGVLSAESEVNLAKSKVDLAEEILINAEEMKKNGFISASELEQHKANRDVLVAEKQIADNNLQLALSGLGILIGDKKLTKQNLSKMVESTKFEMPEPSNSEYWSDLAEKNNLEILQNKVALKIADKNTDIKEYEHLPKFQLFAKSNNYFSDLSRNNAGSNFDDGHFDTGMVGVQMNWKLFTGGSVTADIDAAKNRFYSAKEKYEYNKMTIRQGTETALMNLQSVMTNINAHKKMVEAKNANYSNKKIAFEQGTETQSSVMTAELELIESKNTYEKLRYDYVLKLVEFYKIIGILTPNKIDKINLWLVNR